MAHILIVEDNGTEAALIGVICENAGHTCDTAANVPDAWQLLQEGQYDLVLLDIALPNINGVELARRMRAHEDLADTGIIALTAWNEEQVRPELQRLGIEQIIHKPFDARTLRSLLIEILA